MIEIIWSVACCKFLLLAFTIVALAAAMLRFISSLPFCLVAKITPKSTSRSFVWSTLVNLMISMSLDSYSGVLPSMMSFII